MAREFDKSDYIKHVILCSRRLGKSHLLCTLAIEAALKKPYTHIKFLTATRTQARDIVQPLMNKLLMTCPPTIKPVYNVNDHRWKFPNGSEILLHGVDREKGEDLRGQSADFAIIDEAGFVDSLKYVLTDILMPMIIERAGRIILSSTPPRDETHDFIHEIALAEANKSLTKRVLTDCSRFTQKQIEIFTEEAGGVDSETYRREYMCEVIRSVDHSVIPEFTDKVQSKIVVDSFPILPYKPTHYVSLDVGFIDFTAAVFAYYDFERAKICIQQEYVGKQCTTDDIANNIMDIERSLKWNNNDKVKRISDVDHRLLADLKNLYNLKFTPTPKDNKEATINLLRTIIRDERIEIHSSCTNLIQQLKYGMWKISSTGTRQFQRSSELGHLDLIDALIYLVRNIDMKSNPLPTTYNNEVWCYWGTPTNNSGLVNSLKNIFSK